LLQSFFTKFDDHINLYSCTYLYKNRSSRTTIVLIIAFSHLRFNVKFTKLSQIYRRLEAHKPAYTISGSGGGGTHVYHWDEPRALTNRERARIQTFPDTYEFIGSKESVRKQIGMAVPPAAAQIIFEAILKTLANLQYSSIKANVSIEDFATNTLMPIYPPRYRHSATAYPR
jgi:hypothetical protein